MRILGIDPGTRASGYGVVDGEGHRLRFVASGVVQPPAREVLPRRLLVLAEELDALIRKFHPDALAVENLFYAKNIRSAITLGQAQGVALFTAARHDLPITEYAPATIKLAVVGTGRAEKGQVQRMVCALLNLPRIPGSLDASDALAVAICHLHHVGNGECGMRNAEWKKKERVG